MLVKKESLTLPKGFAIDPSVDMHVRAGKVVSTSFTSRELTVQFIDGDHDGSEFVEEPVTAVTVVGSDDPETTYAPSAAIFGRGDLVSVVVMAPGVYYAVLAMDRYSAHDSADPVPHSNREGYALVKGHVLYDTLNGLVVDLNDYAENSYIEMLNPVTGVVTRIEGDPDKRHVMRRMLDYFGTVGQADGHFCHTTDAGYPIEILGGGPQANPQERISMGSLIYTEPDSDDEIEEEFSVAVNGIHINGFPNVVDLPFAEADLSAALSAYHPTLQNLWEASCHPLVSSTVKMKYAPTVFRFGDMDSEYVLVAACYPAWSTCQYVHFLEVPVYCLAERKKLELDANGEVITAWQKYADHIRIIHTIQRNYLIDWSTYASDGYYSERITRALSIIASRLNGSGQHTFGVIDSRSYDGGGTLLDFARLHKYTGTVERIARTEEQGAASNGSMWDYNVTHGNPVDGFIDNRYTSRVQYFNDDAGTVWEKHTCMTPDTIYPVVTDGTNEFTKKVDFLFDITGELTYNGGWQLLDSESSHQWFERFYLNGVLVYTDSYSRVHTGGPEDTAISTTSHQVIHLDMELGLIVAEETVVTGNGIIDPNSGTVTVDLSLVVFWKGAKYTIWALSFTDPSYMPEVENFPYPWHSGTTYDPDYPVRPGTVPHDVDVEYQPAHWWPPFGVSFNIPTPFPFETGVSGKVVSYPYLWGECVAQCMFVKLIQGGNDDDTLNGYPYVQVSVDSETVSWSVRCPIYRDIAFPGMSSVSYPNITDTVICRNDGVPTFIIPPVTKTVVL